MPSVKLNKQSRIGSRRGDTIIEVMFAFVIFSLVAIITISMMNLGIAASERSLELVVARNELNAQAEALRFIHSSYISELTLPLCPGDPDAATGTVAGAEEKCQRFRSVWRALKDAADSNTDPTLINDFPLSACQIAYENSNRHLNNSGAFIINTRRMATTGTGLISGNDVILRASADPSKFVEAPLGARLVYTGAADTSDNVMSSLGDYTNLQQAEGIWVIATKESGSTPRYYDFYIEACWYGSNNPGPTAIDTMIRLYNPEGT